MARNKDKPALAIDRRCLTREQAAEYCGVSPSGFSAWQRQGLVPGPIPGTNRWDRKALDAALDKASGLREAGGGARQRRGRGVVPPRCPTFGLRACTGSA